MSEMPFVQPAPQLGNQYREDRVLIAHLHRMLTPKTLAAIESDLLALGNNAADAWRSTRQRSAEEPVLTQWDAWGNRVDRIEPTRAWRTSQPLAARFGLVAAGHDPAYGAAARVHQFSLVYLFHCASEFYTCPLAMSDGAATAIRASDNTALIERVLPRLLSRDPAQQWLSGQWMTETNGGSDVSCSETTARKIDGQWRLYGRKWFTSAINSQMALALARPEGAPAGADGLALFCVEPRDAKGNWQGVDIDKLKRKLGTRELPTAEIHLDGTPAHLVSESGHGVRAISPMLNVTRTWNAVCAIATMRRALALALDYAHRRHAFGSALIQRPLHRATLADLQARFEAAFALTFHVAELLGVAQTDTATPAQQNQLRLLTPLAKLWTGKLAVALVSEACECLGGAGYIEDTGLPQLLRDAQVFPIWEGTTNVLALDFLRALKGAGGIDTLIDAQTALHREIDSEDGRHCSNLALEHTAAFAERLRELAAENALEAHARELALGFAQGFALSLAARHADWALREQRDTRSIAAARRFANLLAAPTMRDDADAVAIFG
jgi:alkylation response protein AidB-like acyl-CoA dehydrogenase